MTRNFHRHVQPAVWGEPTQNGAAQRRERGLSRCAAVSQGFTLIAYLRSGFELFSETRRHPATHRAALPLARCNAQGLRSSGAARRSAPDSSARRFRAAIPWAAVETRRATIPALDRSNTFRSRAAALALRPRDTRWSFAAASASANCSRYR